MNKQEQQEDLAPVTLITGATHGIGRQLALLAARDGHRLWLVARSPSELAFLAEELRERFSVTVDIQAVDLSRRESGQQIAARIAAAKCHVRYLINCAGSGLSGPFAAHDHEALLRLTELNVRSLTDLCRLFLPGMLARREGGILNIASLGGFVPGPHQAAYYASKAYVLSLSRALAYEAWPKGVRVAVVAPGPVRTDFHDNMGAVRSYYYRLLPVLSPQYVAWVSYVMFKLGRRLIVPGISNLVFALLLSFLPGFVTIPIMGWLLKRR